MCVFQCGRVFVFSVFVCVCVRACMRAHARVCVCVPVCVCFGIKGGRVGERGKLTLARLVSGF
jgi:hypothetical protein